MVNYVIVIPFITLQVMCPDNSFDELLNLVEMNYQLACDPEAGGCGELNYIHHLLSSPPHVFTTGGSFIINTIFPIVPFFSLIIMYMCSIRS